jgi:hypothetical protein
MGFFEQIGAGIMRGMLQEFSAWSLARRQRRIEGKPTDEDLALTDWARDAVRVSPPEGPPQPG